MTRIVAADLGGTHARFALAELEPGTMPRLGEMRSYRTREHRDLPAAWAAFARDSGGELPRAAALAVAAPIEGDTLTFMNNDWRVDRHGLAGQLGLDRLTLLNDFGAVAQAVASLGPEHFAPIRGPASLADKGIVSVMGPGTGLGVAILDRRGADSTVIETDASHIGFAPLDAEEEGVRDALRDLYGRASVERVVCGQGLLDVYAHLNGAARQLDDAGTLWTRAIGGSDPLATRALDLLVRVFGAVAGDIALAQGAMGVVLAGTLANRIAPRLRGAPFEARFIDKGRYRARMERTPVRLLTYGEPGLLGAAIAFDRDWPDA